MYAQGQYYDVKVDDTVPIFAPTNDVEFDIMAESYNHIMWGPLLEKGYAKFIGSYEKIAKGGTASEAIRAMTGLPGFIYHSKHVDDAWQQINDAVERKDIVTCSTHIKHRNKRMRHLGIQTRYVYSVLGTLEITYDRGEVTRYVHVRNPWAEEHYEGPQLELSSLSENELTQIPSDFLDNDGEYLIEEKAFKGYFPVFEISKKLQGNVFESSKQITSPTRLAQHTFTVTPQDSGIHYVSVDTWYHRMYRLGCVSGLSAFKIEVVDTDNKMTVRKELYHDQ